MTAALSGHASRNLDPISCAGPYNTTALPLQQLDNLQGAMDDPPTRSLKRKRDHMLGPRLQKPEPRPTPPQSHRQSTTTGEFHNRSQLSTDGPLPRSPAPSLSTEITTTTGSRERSHSMLSTSTPPTDTDPELAARMDEIYADGWVRKITNDSIECFLCGRWYRVGQQYRNMHIWRAHRKKCSQRALAFRGLRKSNTPVTYAAHRCEIDPDDEFALEWIDHPQVHDLDKTYVHCNQCNTKIQRKQWPTHVRAACVGKKRYKGYVYESVSSSDDEPNPKAQSSNHMGTKQKLIASTTGVPPARATWNSLSANIDVFPLRLPTPTRKRRSRSSSATASRKIITPAAEAHVSSDSDDDTSGPSNRRKRPLARHTALVSLSSSSDSDANMEGSSSSSSSGIDVSSSSSEGGSLVQRAKRPGPPPTSQYILTKSVSSAEESSSSSDDSDDKDISTASIARARRGVARGFGRGMGISRGGGTGRGGRLADRSVVVPVGSDVDMAALSPRTSAASAPASVAAAAHRPVTATAAPVESAPWEMPRGGFRVPKLMKRSIGGQHAHQQQAEVESQPERRNSSANADAMKKKLDSSVVSPSAVVELPAPLPSTSEQPTAPAENPVPVSVSQSPVSSPKRPLVEHHRRVSLTDAVTGKIKLPALQRGRRPVSDHGASAAVMLSRSVEKASQEMQQVEDMQIDLMPITAEKGKANLTLVEESSSISPSSTSTVAMMMSQSPPPILVALERPQSARSNSGEQAASMLTGTLAPLQPWHRKDGVPYTPYPYLQHSDGPRLGVSFQQEAERVDMKIIAAPQAEAPRKEIASKTPQQQTATHMLDLSMPTPTAALVNAQLIAATPAHTRSTGLANIASRAFDPSAFVSAFQTSNFGLPVPDILPHGVPSPVSWNAFGSSPSTTTSQSEAVPSHEELVRKYGRYLHPGPTPFYSFRHEPRPDSVGRLSTVVFNSTTSATITANGGAETTRPRLDVALMMESTMGHFRTTVNGSAGLWRATRSCSSTATPVINAPTLLADPVRPELKAMEEQWPPPVHNTVGLSLAQIVDAKIPPFAF